MQIRKLKSGEVRRLPQDDVVWPRLVQQVGKELDINVYFFLLIGCVQELVCE